MNDAEMEMCMFLEISCFFLPFLEDGKGTYLLKLAHTRMWYMCMYAYEVLRTRQERKWSSGKQALEVARL